MGTPRVGGNARDCKLGRGLTLPWMIIHKLSAELCAATSLPLSILEMNEAERAEVGNTKSEVGETRMLASRRSER